MQTADEILNQGAETFFERQKTYKSNWRMVGPAFKALFPEGLTLKTEEDFNRFQFFMLMMVKISRYASNVDKGGHSDSLIDLATYTAMLESYDQEMKEKG